MNRSYDYMDETSINDEFICIFCRLPFVDPVETPCDKTFCRQCITSWIERGNSSCPLCRQYLSVDKLTRSPRIIRNILDQLKVKCSICGQINLERSHFDDHIQRICPQMILSCPFSTNHCAWKGQREQLNTHLTMSHTGIDQQFDHQVNQLNI